MTTRRGFLELFGGAVAAPAIVPLSSLMPVKALIQPPLFPFVEHSALVTFDEIVTATLRSRQTKLEDQIIQANAAMRSIMRRELYNV